MPANPQLQLQILDSTPHLSVLVDESELSSNASVDTSVAAERTAVTEGHDTDEGLGAGGDERASRVTLARVLASGSLGGADHVGGDGRGAVLGLAGGAGDDGDADVAESRGGRAAGGGGSPVQ
jgi:hypothetical protein